MSNPNLIEAFEKIKQQQGNFLQQLQQNTSGQATAAMNEGRGYLQEIGESIIYNEKELKKMFTNVFPDLMRNNLELAISVHEALYGSVPSTEAGYTVCMLGDAPYVLSKETINKGDTIGSTISVLTIEGKKYVLEDNTTLTQVDLRKKGDTYYYTQKVEEENVEFELIDINDKSYVEKFQETNETWDQFKYSQVYSISEDLPADLVIRNVTDIGDQKVNKEKDYKNIAAGSHIVVCPAGEIMIFVPGELASKIGSNKYTLLEDTDGEHLSKAKNQYKNDVVANMLPKQKAEYDKLQDVISGQQPLYYLTTGPGRKIIPMQKNVCAFKWGSMQTAIGGTYNLLQEANGNRYFIEAKKAFAKTHTKTAQNTAAVTREAA